MEEDTILVNLALASSTGANVHSVATLVGLYRSYLHLSRTKTDERKVEQYQERAARMAYALALVCAGVAPEAARAAADALK